jgi:two-component system phosphate regulon response regulator PhoB
VPKVLLVEDDFSLRDIYSARFQAEGYTLVTASDGEEALATAMREHPDLIVLDVMMPKISGFDVLDILRSTPETKNTKVIMMTALSQETDRERGEALGVNKYLVKSQVTLEDVVATVKQVLGSTGPATAPAPAPAQPTPAKTPPSAPPSPPKGT